MQKTYNSVVIPYENPYSLPFNFPVKTLFDLNLPPADIDSYII